MRASPTFQVVLSRFGVWRAAVGAVCFLAASAMLTWMSASAGSLASWPVAVGGLALLGICVCGVSLGRVREVSLRWDGQSWHLGPPGSAGAEPQRGELSVRIDLGVWMLLGFQPETRRWPHSTVWLPAQRRGLELEWHALRCAAYAPRPSLLEPAVPNS